MVNAETSGIPFWVRGTKLLHDNFDRHLFRHRHPVPYFRVSRFPIADMSDRRRCVRFREVDKAQLIFTGAERAKNLNVRRRVPIIKLSLAGRFIRRISALRANVYDFPLGMRIAFVSGCPLLPPSGQIFLVIRRCQIQSYTA